MTKKAISAQERDAWRGFRRMAEIISGRITQEITRTTGLSGPDFGVLMQLDEAQDGQRRQRDVQAFLEWDKTRLSHQLTRMATRGLIERESAGASGVMIRITEEGRRQLDAAKPVHAEGVRRYFLDHLSPHDVENLQGIAQKLRKALLDLES
ncbi:TPA: winged helix-turn-helix transcriptional regulator [Klebsiella variicola]|nr:winged helix-turn-helix transcriptional regulator [Klebsiella variicola]HBR2062022.1 winged helix-turn-helix transcriptional regulator [Klebsiella variicola]